MLLHLSPCMLCCTCSFNFFFLKTNLRINDFNKEDDVSVRVSFLELYSNSFRNLIQPISKEADVPASAYAASFSAQDDDNASVASDATGVSMVEASKLGVNSASGVDLHDHPSTGIFFISETVLRHEVKSAEELLHLVAKGS